MALDLGLSGVHLMHPHGRSDTAPQGPQLARQHFSKTAWGPVPFSKWPVSAAHKPGACVSLQPSGHCLSLQPSGQGVGPLHHAAGEHAVGMGLQHERRRTSVPKLAARKQRAAMCLQPRGRSDTAP